MNRLASNGEIAELQGTVPLWQWIGDAAAAFSY
jgi:hypothetical protein